MIRGLASIWTVGIILISGGYFNNYKKQSVIEAAMNERDRCNQGVRHISITEEYLGPPPCFARFSNKLDIQNCQLRELTSELKWLDHALQDESEFMKCEQYYVDRLCESWWTSDLCETERSRMNVPTSDVVE